MSVAILNSLEMCAGAGGQALGLEMAGFNHIGLIEIDPHCCSTLKLNRPLWNVIESDLEKFEGNFEVEIDLISGGLPCPPFSHAGKQLGRDDERNLFPAALNLIRKFKPKAIMIENVRGILDSKFDSFREEISCELAEMGYWSEWKLFNASDFGVCQLRPRAIMIALNRNLRPYFSWPLPHPKRNITVGELLRKDMSSNGWKRANRWAEIANTIAPTIVGGSKKHGGPDLGPTRAKYSWLQLGVDGSGIANEAPKADFEGLPKLTTDMVAKIQGFPSDWKFVGKKTSSYRQIGNAFPPPFACAMGLQLKKCLETSARQSLLDVAS